MAGNLVNQPSGWPTRKVGWMTAAALIASILADYVIALVPALQVIDTAEIEMLLEAAFVTPITFAVGYLTRDRG